MASDPSGSALYDRIGGGYGDRRKTDPRIYRRIRFHLEGMSSVLNVGAGTGSYEPHDLPVTAVEPSTAMIAQRRNRSNVVQAAAESLPMGDEAFDAVTAFLTLHHWHDWKTGLAECARVARRRVVILTWDPACDGFWLVHDYFPELLAWDRKVFPAIDDITRLVSPVSVEVLPIPADCVDGFLGAYWRRPAAYLDSEIRSGISSFQRASKMAAGLMELERDIVSGRWARRHGRLLEAPEWDVGYRLVRVALR